MAPLNIGELFEDAWVEATELPEFKRCYILIGSCRG
jgi:hypothetical protein